MRNQVVEKKIQEMRESPGSFRKLAVITGISRSELTLILQRKRNPSLPVFSRLVRAMGVRADTLLEYLSPREPQENQQEARAA